MSRSVSPWMSRAEAAGGMLAQLMMKQVAFTCIVGLFYLYSRSLLGVMQKQLGGCSSSSAGVPILYCHRVGAPSILNFTTADVF